VKAPREWPKSSASASDSGTAAALKATMRSLARVLRAWMVSAISSLPVPVSPWISTGVFIGEIRSISRSTGSIAALWAIRFGIAGRASSSARSIAFSRR
jgi:hypothetical protein